MNQEVLARVAGKDITQAEFHEFLKGVPADQRKYLSDPQFRERCLGQLISMRLYEKLGEELKLEETEVFKKSLELAKAEILAQMAMQATSSSFWPAISPWPVSAAPSASRSA